METSFNGPWTARMMQPSLGKTNPLFGVLDKDKKIVAKDVPEKVAALISAAPDLLDALIRAHNCINDVTELLPMHAWPDNPVGPTGVLRQCFDAVVKAMDKGETR